MKKILKNFLLILAVSVVFTGTMALAGSNTKSNLSEEEKCNYPCRRINNNCNCPGVLKDSIEDRSKKEALGDSKVAPVLGK